MHRIKSQHFTLSHQSSLRNGQLFSSDIYNFILGSVAFVSGGSGLASVELYSPNGLCSKSLSSMPVTKYNHGLFVRNNEIFACGGTPDYNCYIYFIKNNTWTTYTTVASSSQPYAIFNERAYFGTFTNTAQVLNLSTKTWSTWPLAPINNFACCQVTWSDAFIRFGGVDELYSVLQFNHTTQKWTLLTDQAPMQFYFSGCTLFNDDKVLVVGSGAAEDMNKFTVYHIPTNQWTANGTVSSNIMNPTLITLGKRVFVIQSTHPSVTNEVLEFHPSNKSFTILINTLSMSRIQLAAVSVPARLFRHIVPTCTGYS